MPAEGAPDVDLGVCGDDEADDGGAEASKRMVECSSERTSNMRTDPSAPTEANTSRDDGDHATSYTSRSCAMSCVMAVVWRGQWRRQAARARTLAMSQIVQVVSMLEVTMYEGSSSDQENDVSGAE